MDETEAVWEALCNEVDIEDFAKRYRDAFMLETTADEYKPTDVFAALRIVLFELMKSQIGYYCGDMYDVLDSRLRNAI